MAASEKSCGRPPTPPAAGIHQNHTAGGANGSTMVMLFVTLMCFLCCCLCFLCRPVWLSSLAVCRQVGGGMAEWLGT